MQPIQRNPAAMLIITVGSRIRATWPFYEDPAIREEILRRIRLVGAEFDESNSCWWVSLSKADQLLELFWNASFDYDVICAATDAGRRRNEAFYKFLVSAGVKLRCDESGAVCAVGENVSPLLAELVAERSDALWALLIERGVTVPTPETRRVVKVEIADADRKFEPVLKGIRNAWEQEQRERGSQRRKSKYEQGSLGL